MRTGRRRWRSLLIQTISNTVPLRRGLRNQVDHIVTGRAVMDAIRDAANRWVFRELRDEGFEPWPGVRVAFVCGSLDGAHGVDVTDTFAGGISSLKPHTAYLAGLGDGLMSDPEQLLESFARETGSRLGTTYAALFEVVPFSFASARSLT